MFGTDALQSWQVIEFVSTLTVADSCSDVVCKFNDYVVETRY
jgi:hypothetical protein